MLPALLDAATCAEVAALYDQDALFRSHILMARHGFGQGEYKYFAYPLPEPIASLRTTLYPPLARVANTWNSLLGLAPRFPDDHAGFLERCHAAGQTRPTPLLLRYVPGDYNCLHQDLYGEHVFPLQVTVLLSRRCLATSARQTMPDFGARQSAARVRVGHSAGDDERDQSAGQSGRDQSAGEFEGGEFVLVEQRPRMQSRPMVVPLQQGDAVVFAVNQRPVQGTRGTYRVTLRHGVSEVRGGQRQTLGIIFHDAA